MKKIAAIILMLVFVLILVSCGPRISIKGYFVDVVERTTSISFSIEIEDPKEEITGNVIVEIIDTKTNNIVNYQTLYEESQYRNLSFSGLNNQNTYRIDVRVMVGRESIVIVSHQVKLLPLTTLEIKTVEEFMAMGNNPEGNYILGQNIDFSGVDFISPFSTVSKTFSGTFDGKGYTLSNIKFSATSGNIGVFAYVSSASIKNLNIRNIEIGSSAQRLAIEYASKVGILAGSISSPDAVIENISIEQANIYLTSSSTYQLYVGGMFGDLRAVAKDLTQKDVLIDVLTTSYAKVNVGGIAGYVGIDGGLRRVYSRTDVNQTVAGNYIDISTKTWNISVGGVVGEFDSRLSRGLQDVIQIGDISVDLNFGTPSGQKGTYNVYVGGLIGRSYGQIYQAMYMGSIFVDYEENEFESSITKSFFVGGLSGHYETNLEVDHAAYYSDLEYIDVNVSPDSKVYLSYTIGFNPISLNHEVVYNGNGTLTKNGNPFNELKPSVKLNSMEGYFTSEFMTMDRND